MEHRFLQYIEKHQLFNHDQPLVVAVSGGVDSMVLLWLLQHFEYNITVAHCNFNLRPGDCDMDQQFVENYCNIHQIPFQVKSFNTLDFAKENHLSVEMAARQLRYDWFEEIRQLLNAEYIATAHHASDNVETILLNIVRGTGLKGLTGIKPKNNRIVRPLLWASDETIRHFAILRQIPFRIDNSNNDTTIPRNKIRHDVIPLLKNLNPSFQKTMQQNLSIWNDWFMIASQQIDYCLRRTLTEEDEKLIFNLPTDSSPELLRLTFFSLLQKLNYNGNQASDILNLLESQTGTTITTSNHRFIKDRRSILIFNCQQRQHRQESVLIDTIPCEISLPISLRVNMEDYFGQPFKAEPNFAELDADKIEFPLTLRRWQHGDRFFPLGLKGSKKISDFLTDLKITPHEKEHQWVLTDRKKIIWVVGHRIDDRCRVTSQTQKILKITILPPKKN